MKKLALLLTLFVALLCAVPASAAEGIIKVKNPVEVRNELTITGQVPKEIEGLQWNRWTSKNFVVCSLNDKQAQYLHKHLELVRGWVFARWGMMEIDFTTECKLICVDDAALFKKLFNLDTTRVEIRRDENGKIKESIIFLLCSDLPSKTVPVPLTEVCLAEFGQRHKVAFGMWATRGMAQLNGTISQIRERIAEVKPLLDRNDPLFFSKGLFEMTPDQYAKLEPAKQRLYDNCALIVCLMIRKEFGQNHYLRMLKAASEGNPETALKSVLGFDSYDSFDKTLKRFMIDITREVVAGKTPSFYLQITEKK